MTVKELIKKLKEFPSDYEVRFHEYNSPYDRKINNVIILAYDKKRGNKLVTIEG